jgi:enoyl-CoA hydratase/carnithine racemase
MILTGEPVPVTEALLWGIVDELTPASEVDATVARVLGRLDGDEARDAFMARRRGLAAARVAAAR